MSWEGLAPGTVLADTYRIVRRIGKGGMAEVYEATHTRAAGRCAVKVLPAKLSGEALARFRRHAEITSSLRHPNIVQVIDFNVTPAGNPYLVMELLEGEELARRLGRPLPLPWVLDVVGQTASALTAAQARGIVHRDLKPQNLFLVALEGRDVVKVGDFAISQLREATTQGAGELAIGTPQYLAPEQAQGRLEQIDARTDQFALAAITYEMLAGRAAFQGGSVPSVLYQVVHQAPPPLAEANPAVTAEVQAVVERALAKNRDGRFASVREFHDELVRAASGQLPVRVPTPLQGAPSWPRSPTTMSGATGEAVTVSRRRPWLGLALVLAAAGAGGVLWTARPTSHTGVPAAAPAPADAAMPSRDAVADRQGKAFLDP